MISASHSTTFISFVCSLLVTQTAICSFLCMCALLLLPQCSTFSSFVCICSSSFTTKVLCVEILSDWLIDLGRCEQTIHIWISASKLPLKTNPSFCTKQIYIWVFVAFFWRKHWSIPSFALTPMGSVALLSEEPFEAFSCLKANPSFCTN